MTIYRNSKFGPLIAATLAAAVIESPAALAAPSLMGDTVTANYMHNATVIATSNILVQPPFPEVSCSGGSSGAGICAAFLEATTIDIEGLTIDFNEAGGATYDTITFDGVNFTNLNFGDGESLGGFLLSTNLPGLTTSDIGFTGNSIEFNAEGLPFPDSYYIDLTLTPVSAPVPEPGSLALFGTALVGFGFRGLVGLRRSGRRARGT